MNIDLTESDYHLVIAALQEYGTSWMAVASAAAKYDSMDISMAKEKGDAAFVLLRRLREAKAEKKAGGDAP